MINGKWCVSFFSFRVLLFLVLLIFPFLNGCRTASRSVETGPPGPVAPAYPIILTGDDARKERALNVWTGIVKNQGIADAPAPVLHPVTATVIGLPVFTNQFLALPKVGETTPMTEEEVRESLRRFMNEGGAFLCGPLQQISLISHTSEANGTKRAIYQQQIFRYSLRGEFGKTEISFLPSRQIVQINSTCLPNSDSLQRLVAELRPDASVTLESIISTLKGRTLSIKKDDAGAEETFIVNESDEINAQELVIFSRTADANNSSIALHLAWEIRIANKVNAYFDSYNGEFLAATAIASQPSVKQN